MRKLFLKYKRHIFFLIVLMAAEPSINSVLNFWLQRLFDSAVPGADKVSVMRLLTGGFLFWLLKRLVNFTGGMIKARYICNVKRDVKSRMFEKMFRADVEDILSKASSGGYLSLFTNDINVLEQRFFNQVISLLSGVFAIVILGASFIAMNRKLAAAILVTGSIAMLQPVIFSKELNKKSLRYSDMISKFTQSITEYFTAYSTIKNYSAEREIIRKFSEENQNVEDAKFESEYVLTLADGVGSLLSWFMQFVGVGLGLMMVIDGEILIGTVIASQSFASDLAMPLQEIIANVNAIRSMKEIIGKLEAVTETGGIKEGDCSRSGCRGKGDCDIVFDDLCLNIGGKAIIRHFSYEFKSGKKYLIVGLNGAGKTSLFRVLKKWYKNCQGSIFINKQDAAGMKNDEISRTVSYLSENVALFSGTVRDNICLFRQFPSEAFEKAIADAHLNLNPEREIADGGRNISSGESRKIEIARSLIGVVPVLIFDEVVSTLDIETAYEIEKLALSLQEKTVIFISHNFSGKLIREYDEILVMDSGRLAAHGTYDELIGSCEYFRKICGIKFG